MGKLDEAKSGTLLGGMVLTGNYFFYFLFFILFYFLGGGEREGEHRNGK